MGGVVVVAALNGFSGNCDMGLGLPLVYAPLTGVVAIRAYRVAEKQLWEREERLHGLANSLPGAVFRAYFRPDGDLPGENQEQAIEIDHRLPGNPRSTEANRSECRPPSGPVVWIRILCL